MVIRLSYFFYCSAILFIVGVFVESIIEPPSWFWFLFLTLSLSFLILFFWFFYFARGNKETYQTVKLFLLLSFCSLFFFLGFYRTDNYLLKDNLSQIRSEGKTELIGVVIEEPSLSGGSVKYKIKTEQFGEYVLLFMRGFSEYEYGDKILVKGNFSSPENFNDFDYVGFLRKEKILTISYYPQIDLISKNHGSLWNNSLLELKNDLRRVIVRFLPSPQAEMLLAIALGDYGEISDDLRDMLSRTGLVHIISISGMHITIIASILVNLFAFGFKLGVSRSFYLVSVVLLIYIILVGAPASAVRSGIMAFILLLSQKVGREYFATKSLLIAGFLMLVWNPLLLKYDIGFQLSFLAVFGILYIAPIFKYFFNKVIVLNSQTVSAILEIVAITLGAQLTTFPLVIHNFGIVSVVSPLANALVVPATSLMLVFGFLMMFLGIFSNILGFIFFIPTNFILSYCLWIAEFLDGLKFSSFVFENFGLFGIIFSYSLMIVLVVWSKKFLKIDIKI